MRYTKATRSILAFIEEHGFITCNIASRIQYKGQKQAYINAARKLRTMEQNKLLVHYIYPQTKEYIYQIKAKQISDHKKILIEKKPDRIFSSGLWLKLETDNML